MKLLLDTHVLVWFAAEPSRLRAEVVEALQSESTEVIVSVAPAGRTATLAGRTATLAEPPGVGGAQPRFLSARTRRFQVAGARCW